MWNLLRLWRAICQRELSTWQFALFQKLMRNSSSCMCCKAKEFIQLYSDPPHLASSDNETAALWAVRLHCQHWPLFVFQLKSLRIHTVLYCKLCTGLCKNRSIVIHFYNTATAWLQLSEINSIYNKSRF